MFRFTIRDVLWLTVVAGLVVAWWTDHRQLYSQRKWSIERTACESLRGQSRGKIVELLGSPEGRIGGDRWLYYAGTGHEANAEWLSLGFYNDIVVDAQRLFFPRKKPPVRVEQAAPGLPPADTNSNATDPCAAL